MKRLNEVVISIDFGPVNPNELISSLKSRIDSTSKLLIKMKESSVPEVILEHEKNLFESYKSRLARHSIQPTNESVRVFMDNIWRQNGGEGTKAISFRRPETFIENLRFYARTYEILIKALHSEAEVSLPDSPIIFSAESLKQQ